MIVNYVIINVTNEIYDTACKTLKYCMLLCVVVSQWGIIIMGHIAAILDDMGES